MQEPLEYARLGQNLLNFLSACELELDRGALDRLRCLKEISEVVVCLCGVVVWRVPRTEVCRRDLMLPVDPENMRGGIDCRRC